MSTEKVSKTDKESTMKSKQDVEEFVREVVGEDLLKTVLEKIEASADARVEKNKKEMSTAEREKFRHECFRKEVWKEARKRGVELTQPSFASSRYWADNVLKSVTTVVVAAAGVLVAGAVTKRFSESAEESTTESLAGSGTLDSPFRASARPSRRTSNSENIASL